MAFASYETEQLVRRICERNDLDLVRVLPNRSRAAFVAHVRNRRGADIMIKQASSPRRARREIGANQRWATVGAATFATELEPGVLAREFSPGILLKELPGFGVKFAPEVGALLAAMHSVKLPEPGIFLSPRDYIRERAEAQKAKITFPRGHYRIFRQATERLLRETAFGDAMVHGDFSGGNVLVADHRLYAFDARGFCGGAALDLCGWVMHIPNTDPLELLRELLVGYGEAPAGLAAMLAWRVVVSAQRSRYGPQHRLLADRIAQARTIDVIEEWLAAGRASGPPLVSAAGGRERTRLLAEEAIRDRLLRRADEPLAPVISLSREVA